MGARVLLTSVPRPLGPRWGDAPSVGYDAVGNQFTRAQGVLCPQAFEHHYGLEYIAANLDAPTVSLQFPTEAELVRELAGGDYTHVGISFNVSTAHHMGRVCRWVREHAPKATIVLGGFGAALPQDYLLRHGDVVCRGEGAAFFRELLGEPPRDPPGHHPLIQSTTRLMGLPLSRSGMVFGGLGCPAGCDFCCTSHQLQRRHVPLLPTGEHLVRVIRGYRRLDPRAPAIQLRVLDEDFLSHRSRALDLRERVLEEGLSLSMFVFASVRSLSLYRPAELVEMGIGAVFVGYEGAEAPYAKRQGRDWGELFADLRRHGIWVQTSMMIGMDYQDEATVRREFEALMALEPAAPLYSLHVPLPGTPLHDCIESQGRWLPPYREDREARWRFSDAFSCVHQHPHMSPQVLRDLQTWCYEEDYRRLGPTLLRIGQVWCEGWLHLRDRDEPSLRRRAGILARSLRDLAVLLPLVHALAPSDGVRDRVRRLQEAIRPLAPGRLPTRASSLALFPLAGGFAAARRLGFFSQPRTLRHTWWGEGRPPCA